MGYIGAFSSRTHFKKIKFDHENFRQALYKINLFKIYI